MEDVSAQKKDDELLFENKTSEHIKPKKKEEPLEPEESLYDMENIEQKTAGQSSSLATLKSATQTMPGSAEGSRQSSGQLRSLGGEAELVHLSSVASPNNLQSATETPPVHLEENELLSLKQHSLGVTDEPVETLAIASLPINQSVTDTPSDLLDESERSSGFKTETVETLSIASLPINQSTTDASALDLTNLSGELPLNRLSLGIKAETVATPSNVQSASDCLDFIEDIPLTLQQREAISRRHHLKFITGHYGSGKVTVSYT